MSTINIDPKRSRIIVEIEEGGANSQGVTTTQETQAANSYPTLGVLPGARPQALRRRRVTKTSGLINFYDLGLVKPENGGDYQDRDLTITPPLADTINLTEAIKAGIRAEALPLLNTPLAIPLEQWVNRFKKVSYNNRYRYIIVIDSTDQAGQPVDPSNDNWTAQGLKYEKFDTFYLFPNPVEPYKFYDLGGAFESVFLGQATRVTALPEFDSPEVILSLDKQGGAINIFLNPAFFYMSSSKSYPGDRTYTETIGAGSYGNGYFVYQWQTCQEVQPAPPGGFPARPVVGISSGTSKEKYLNFFFTSWERGQILAENTAETPNYDELNKIFTEQMRTHRHARAVEYNYTDTSVITRYIPDTTVTPGIPIYINKRCGVPNNSNVGSASETFSQFSPEAFPVDPNPSTNQFTLAVGGALLAAINQKDKWFFIWRVEE